jgi:hypothetical protein
MATDWFQQAVARIYALQNYRMSLLNQTQNSLGGGGSYSPQAIALNAMLASRDLPAVSPVTPPSVDTGNKDLFKAPDWAPDWAKSLAHIESKAAPYLPSAWGAVGLSKGSDTSVGKRIIDILSRSTYASADVAKAASSGDITGIPGAAWAGLSGKDKSTYADVIEQEFPNAPGWVKGTGGLVGDIFLDPTTYIPVGGIVAKAGSVGRAAKVTSAVDNAVPKVLEGTVLPKGQADAFARYALEGPKPGNRTFVGSPSGVIDITSPDVIRTATAQSLTSQIQGMPKLVHPSGISVEPLFKDVSQTVESTVPVVKQVEVPVEAKAAPRASDTRLASLRAIKMSLMQAEDYPINGIKVSDYLRTARATTDPSKLKMIDTVFNEEAKRLFKTGEHKTKLPRVGEETGATLYTSAGKKTPFGLTVAQASDLLKRGEIGGVTSGFSKSAKFLGEQPIHSAEDLANVYLHNSKGALVPLGEYLTDLGITVKAISPTGEAKVVAEPFKFDFEKPPATRTVSKVVHETTSTTTTKAVRMTPAETISWMSKHAGVLTKEEMAYLRKAGSRSSFDKRLAEIKTKVIVGNFKTLDEVISAAEQGMIPADALKQLLDTAGAKSLADLRSKARAIIDKTGERKKAPVAAKPAAPKPSAKLQRLTGAEAKATDTFATGVKPAEQLVTEGAQLDKVMPTLDQAQIKDLASALGYAVMENILKPLDPKIYPWVTDIKKSLRTSRTPGQGRARNLHGWNSYSQSDVFRTLIRRASADFKKGTEAATSKGAKRAMFKQRASILYDRIVPELRAADLLMRKEGVKLIAGTDNKGILLSLSDVIDALPRPLVEKYLFTPASSVYPTAMLDAAASIAKSIIEGTSLDVARVDAFNVIHNNAKIASMKNSEVFTNTVIDELLAHSDELVQRVEENYARESMKTGTAVVSMTDPVIKNIAQKFADPNVSIGEAFGDFVNRGNSVAAIGKSIAAPAGSVKLANDLVDAKLASSVSPSDIAESTAAKAFAAKPGDPKVAKNQYAARASAADLAAGDVVDIGQKYESRLYTALFKAGVPLDEKIVAFKDVMGEAFVPHYGNRDLHLILRDRRSVTQDFARMHSSLMSNLWEMAHKAYGPDVNKSIQDAFKHAQEGTPVADTVMADLVDQLQKSIDITFGSAANGLGSFAQRNGFVPERVNRALSYYGVPDEFLFDGTKSIAEQADIWKTWTGVEDPLSIMDKYHAAMQKASVETTIGASFSHEFGRATRPDDSYVKITDKNGTSYIAPYIDQSLYYPREMVDQLQWLDKALKGQFTGFKNPNVAAVMRHYDTLIHAWKSGMTIYRPGHHVSNFIGDVTLSWFAGVNNPTVYAKAARIMGRRAKAYRDWDGLKALTEGKSLPDVANGKGIHIKINGKKTFVDDDTIWRMAFEKGLVPDYRTLEDTAFNLRQSQGMTTGRKYGITRPFGGNVRKAAGGLSQARDHWVRIAHQIDVLQKGNWKSLDEAFDAAGNTVRKWHPDGGDLSNFESKYMRRAFMFYSWQRKAIPLVIETLAMKPGKAMVMPKAMYNFSIAMGIDPESISNPFPNDQLFPSFLTDQVFGPQWQGSLPGIPGTGMEGGSHYRGINWPDPASQILSQYGGNDPGRQVLGATSPVARVPLELAFGKNVRTGGNITNTPEYLDQQIPGLGYFDRIFGHTVTGLGSPTKDTARGNRPEGADTTAIFNLLTGLGQVDYSKPNYIRTAQFELRDKLRGK